MASNLYMRYGEPLVISPALQSDVTYLTGFVTSGRLLIRHLQSVLGTFGERTSGVKGELQKRVLDLLYRAARPDAQDPTLFARVKNSILSAVDTLAAQPSVGSGPYTVGYTKSEQKPNMGPAVGSSTAKGLGMPPFIAKTVHFKPSPFHSTVEKIGDYHVLPVMATHKNSKEIFIRSQDSPTIAKCVTDRSYRVMVFCAADRDGIQDVAFPAQAEIRVNEDDVKANLRGIKNKPGTTRPVDITSMLRLKVPSYRNKVTFRYALTHKDFYLQLYVCRVSQVPELVTSIQNGKKISLETVKNWLARKGRDTEVVATSQVLSLKCPLSYVRLKVPCRTAYCKHVACFDATSFLQLQEQGPQWVCPICNGPAKFEQLAVDEYVRDILTRTPDDLDQVSIEPDGTWMAQGVHPVAQPRVSSGDVVEVDDILGLSDDEATPVRSGPVMSLAPSSSAKRKIAEVIDLTLDSSDDDDEPLAPPAKRPNHGIVNELHSFDFHPGW